MVKIANGIMVKEAYMMVMLPGPTTTTEYRGVDPMTVKNLESEGPRKMVPYVGGGALAGGALGAMFPRQLATAAVGSQLSEILPKKFSNRARIYAGLTGTALGAVAGAIPGIIASNRHNKRRLDEEGINLEESGIFNKLRRFTKV